MRLSVHVDCGIVPAAVTLGVAGMQRRLERLGQSDIGAVIARVLVPQVPDPLGQGAVSCLSMRKPKWTMRAALAACSVSFRPRTNLRRTERTSTSRMCGAATSPAKASSGTSSTSRPTSASTIAEASTTVTGATA